MTAVFDRLKDAVGGRGFSEDPAELAPHLEEWRGKYKGHSPLLLKPATTAEVAAILRICHETGTPLVPQGGNTGLVGGQIPFHGEVLLSTKRLNGIRALDESGATLTVEAGVTLAQVQAAADEKHFLFPLSLASEGSCTIGGNIATNAGGTHVLRYGMTRALVLGLEVVTANGTVLDMLRALHKDNTGYDLKQNFIGSEGTLGVITAACLRLFPKPDLAVTAFAAVPSPAAAVALLGLMQARTGGMLSAFELIPRLALDFVTRHIGGTRDPLDQPFEASLDDPDLRGVGSGPVLPQLGEDLRQPFLASPDALFLISWDVEAESGHGNSLLSDIAGAQVLRDGLPGETDGQEWP